MQQDILEALNAAEVARQQALDSGDTDLMRLAEQRSRKAVQVVEQSLGVRCLDARGRFDHEFLCEAVSVDSESLTEVHLAGGYRHLRLSAFRFEFALYGAGVEFKKGRRYRVLIEEVPE